MTTAVKPRRRSPAKPRARAAGDRRLAGGARACYWTGVAGVGTVAALIPAIVAETAGPDSSDSPARVTAGFLAERITILVSGGLFLVAMGFGLVFVVGVSAIIARQAREGVQARIAAASGYLVIALISVYAASFAAIAASIHALRPHESLVYGVFRVISATDDGSGVFIAIFIVAVAKPLRRAGLIGRWLAALGFVTAAVRAIGALDITTLGAWPFGPFMVVGTALCLVWLECVSVALLRRAGAR